MQRIDQCEEYKQKLQTDVVFLTFATDELNTALHLGGVDPGITNIFIASDDHGDNPHQIRKYSAVEYYTRAGYKKNKQGKLGARTGNPALLDIETDIVTFKTSDLRHRYRQA